MMSGVVSNGDGAAPNGDGDAPKPTLSEVSVSSSVPMRDCTVVSVTLNAEERLSNRAKFLINRMSMSSTAPLRCLAMMNSAMPLTSLPLPSNPERK